MRLKRQFKIGFILLLSNIMLGPLASCSHKKDNTLTNGNGGDTLTYCIPGACLTKLYLSELMQKKVGIVANHTSYIGKVHIVDSLLSLGVEVVKIFSPEHGFRGNISAGEEVKNYLDEKTGIEFISLYGNSCKPGSEDLSNIEVMLFDIQDVGVRFYTYISTMHYVMEACAENGIELIILDRPNPNGFYIDGPVLDRKYQSFVGLHPIPIVHGLTIAELALMINGEGWLKGGLTCNLKTIPCKNYTHDSICQLPISPSPNLRNMKAIYLYPSLGLFEGTVMSVARGTDFPFLAFGHPAFLTSDFSFIPQSMENVSKNPKYNNQTCYGKDLRHIDVNMLLKQKRLILGWLIEAYNSYEGKNFFNSFFDNLAGNTELAKQIKEGKSAEEIRKSWEEEIMTYKKMRDKYLLYEDFKFQ